MKQQSLEPEMLFPGCTAKPSKNERNRANHRKIKSNRCSALQMERNWKEIKNQNLAKTLDQSQLNLAQLDRFVKRIPHWGKTQQHCLLQTSLESRLPT